MLEVGFSEECTAGMHQACQLPRGSCRCMCHQHTQELFRQQQQAQQPVIPQLPGRVEFRPAPAALPQTFNTCPKCRSKVPGTENFCRQDGTRLLRGLPCQRCNASMEPEDKFCFQCGASIDFIPADGSGASVEQLVEKLREYGLRIQNERVGQPTLPGTDVSGDAR